MYTWEEPKQKPYAMYIHGFASSPKSGTRASLARALPEYEWLAPNELQSVNWLPADKDLIEELACAHL